MNSSDNVVLITGANGGIGQALCNTFSDADYFVIASDKSKQDCECDAYIQANLRKIVVNKVQRISFFDEIGNLVQGRSLKGLVNNAAIQILSRTDDLQIDDFQESMDVNVIAPLILIKGLLYALEKSAGSVVNIGSIHTKLTKPGFISYASSKSALTGLSQSLAVDLGKRVRINVIQPAATETEMLVDAFSGNPEALDAVKEHHPLMRLAYPFEIAEAALYLVSDKSSFISGSTLSIDGGIGCRLHDPE